MNILFIHQNYPGQFREYIPNLAATGQHKIAFLTQRTAVPKVTDHFIGVYKPMHKPKPEVWRFSRWFETTIGNAGGAARACKVLRDKGFMPDLVTGHANWGELIFVKDVWPDTKLIGLFEYYFLANGGLVNFDPEVKSSLDSAQLLFVNNAPNYLSWEKCDAGVSPTKWQRDTHPLSIRSKLSVLHDGIRTDRLLPDHTSDLKITIGDTSFARGEEIVTYIARNLEPSRGIHIMMRALPRLQALRPKARLAVIGGDGVSYGSQPPKGKTFRSMLIEELGDQVDWSRVHFLGQIPYDSLMNLIRISRCHVYLTVPFVLSWSLMEAMALEKTVVATDVAPVREVVENGKTGFLFDYFKTLDLAERIADVLAHPDNYRSVGQAARRRIVEDYDFLTVRFPAWKAFCNQLLPRAKQFSL